MTRVFQPSNQGVPVPARADRQRPPGRQDSQAFGARARSVFCPNCRYLKPNPSDLIVVISAGAACHGSEQRASSPIALPDGSSPCASAGRALFKKKPATSKKEGNQRKEYENGTS